ncbi:hypothetical protein Maq22A_1p38275 (plasmid) [Methylobacterium aquaticum]|uniref:Uncharacterized protein n=1 Tax=Methylobacterium aquaticum TaxID=270351 RepID=A0A1Y0ZFW8_9HYPH|nr:hypothetical protein Maq22A_1p38275 [Methylobacterium aquaticum]
MIDAGLTQVQSLLVVPCGIREENRRRARHDRLLFPLPGRASPDPGPRRGRTGEPGRRPGDGGEACRRPARRRRGDVRLDPQRRPGRGSGSAPGLPAAADERAGARQPQPGLRELSRFRRSGDWFGAGNLRQNKTLSGRSVACPRYTTLALAGLPGSSSANPFPGPVRACTTEAKREEIRDPARQAAKRPCVRDGAACRAASRHNLCWVPDLLALTLQSSGTGGEPSRNALGRPPQSQSLFDLRRHDREGIFYPTLHLILRCGRSKIAEPRRRDPVISRRWPWSACPRC